MASAVLTQIDLECTCSVPKVYVQCRHNVGCMRVKSQIGIADMVSNTTTKNQYSMHKKTKEQRHSMNFKKAVSTALA